MPTIEQLIQKVQQLEDQLAQQTEKVDALMTEARTAVDYASHAYRVDHYGFVWVWDTQAADYKKTKMRICTPEVADRALESRHIADGAIEGRHLQDNIIEGRMVKNKTIDGRSFMDCIFGPEFIIPNSIHGDSYKAGALIPGKIADDAIWERNIKDRNVTSSKIAQKNILPEHLHQSFVPVVFGPIIEELQNQIDSLQIHGLAVSNIFGGDPHVGISQKKLSWFANYVLTLLEEALGRTLLGYTWTVTPTYIYGEWPTTVHVSALPTNEGDFFEHIWLYSNNELVDEVTDPTDSYSFDIDLQQSVNLRMEAQLLGTVYERTERVNHYDSFWLGGGATYADIMNEAHNINFSDGTRLAKDVTVADGEHIIIMMGDAWVPAFIRADMNGAEIEFDESTVTIDGKNYKVLTSKSIFESGNYSIDING